MRFQPSATVEKSTGLCILPYFAAIAVIAAAVAVTASPAAEQEAQEGEQKKPAIDEAVTQGALRVVDEDRGAVECPLKHTDVQADISGFIARVTVTQTFQNPTSQPIEAVYVFPLPHQAAVDDMTMVVGDRRIVGVIKRRADARSIYQQALAAGQTAALLEQQRPNIFTQSVGNIGPHEEVRIEISYVDVLRYDMGTYEFNFPMVVGPRYNPGVPIRPAAATPDNLVGKVSPPEPDTTRVPDASRISPPVLKPGERTGHDISLSVTLNSGVPVRDLKVAHHQAEIERGGPSRARVKLSPADSLPNKDFVLRYDVVGKKPSMALLAHTGEYSPDARDLGNGYFMLMIQPRQDERLTKSPPREIVFLCDVSGSMSGEPTAKVVETMQSMLGLCRPQDTVQVVTFAGSANKLFEAPVPVNEANIRKALSFTGGFRGSGGTEMLKGVKMAIDQPIDEKRLRIVVMLTDGYIGNEAEIIEHVGRHCGDQIRFWCLGIGSSPNMFLVDGVARQGGGMGKHLGLKDDSESLAQEVMTRIQRAQLAKLQIDWGGLQVAETYPAKLPELWAGRPVIVYGRYSGGGGAEITVSGNVEGEPVEWPLSVELPTDEPEHDVLAKVWARQKIEDLMHQSYYGGSPEVEESVTAIALAYRLMSQYTSFVAVDETEADNLTAPATPPRRMLVPVPLPEGTRWEGFFGPLGDRPGDELAEAASSLGRRFYRLTEGKSTRNGVATNRPLSGLVPTATPALALQPAGGAIGGGGFAGGRGEALARLRSGRDRQSGVQFYGRNSVRGGGAVVAGAQQNFAGQQRVALGDRLAQHPTQLAAVDAFGIVEGDDALKSISAAPGITAAVTVEHVEAITKAAHHAAETAAKLREEGDLSSARQAYVRAFMWDSALANLGHSSGEIASDALAAIEKLRTAQVDAWREKTPALDRRLDLVLRDCDLAAALEQIAKAAGLEEIALVEGSLDDVQALEVDTHVRYLDLRRATVAQALDWLLVPARLQWSAEDGRISVASARRTAGDTAWVYDVSVIATPLEGELPKPEDDYGKWVAASQALAGQFSDTLRAALNLDESRVCWFAPGQLLVVGPQAKHEEIGELLKTLAAPKTELKGDFARLHALTSRRAAERNEMAGKLDQIRRLYKVAAAHDEFAWRLLAGHAAGELDDEALAELQIAWRDPATGKLADSEAAPLILRSWWAVAQAARMRPDNADLASLAETAEMASRPAVLQVRKMLKEDAQSVAGFLGVVYARLASGDRRVMAAELDRLWSTSHEQGSPLATLALVSRTLLEEGTQDVQAPLAQLAESDVAGEDLVVLTALACRNAGGKAWMTFRANARRLLGQQPLAGSVVVLINRLYQWRRLALVD